MRWLKQVGELLDAADEKTTESDLQTLTGDALGVAEKALGAAKDSATKHVRNLDLGIAEGLNDLTSQIGSDLKGGASDVIKAVRRDESDSQPASAEEDQQDLNTSRVAELKQRIMELEARETERLKTREQL